MLENTTYLLNNIKYIFISNQIPDDLSNIHI